MIFLEALLLVVGFVMLIKGADWFGRRLFTLCIDAGSIPDDHWTHDRGDGDEYAGGGGQYNCSCQKLIKGT